MRADDVAVTDVWFDEREERVRRFTQTLLRAFHDADDEVAAESSRIAAETQRIEVQRRLASALRGLAGRMLMWVRSELSGSGRAWSLLETKVYGQPIGLVRIERSGSELDVAIVERASAEVIELRRVIDRPLRAKPAHTARLVELLQYLEGVRHGALAEAEAIDHRVAVDSEALARTRERADHQRREAVGDLEARRSAFVATDRTELTERRQIHTSPSAHPLRDAAWSSARATQRAVEPLDLGSLVAAPRTSHELPVETAKIAVPWVRDLRALGNIVVPFTSEGHDVANGVLEELTLRALAGFPPAGLRCAFVDPLGLGRSDARFLGLGDHNPELIHTKVRSSREDIEALLKDLVGHIESVTQKYLRGEFASIDQYNEAADEIAEPYRLLVIHDFPEQFDRGTNLHLLQRVLENGPRCGIHTIVSARADGGDDYTPGLEDLLRGPTIGLARNDSAWVDLPDTDTSWRGIRSDIDHQIGAEEARALVEARIEAVGPGAHTSGVTTGLDRALATYAAAASSRTHPEIPANTVVPDLADSSTWWQNSSARAVVAPIGLSSAREAAYLRLDSESRSAALLIGRPGSGKSTLIHTWLSALSLLYSPQELELQLIDFKEGVEFSPYARQGLPHARAVAIESEREFGLNVLRSIEGEMKRRSALFKEVDNGVTSLGDHRERGDVHLPRLVVVIDEFQILFDTDDKLALDAATSLEHIIRQGRGYGVHLVLGSQSISGMVGLNRQVLQLIGTRILLQSSEEDAALALGERNDAHRYLTARGEAVINTQGGRPEANVFVKVAYENDETRWERLRDLRERADDGGFTRRPVVFSADRAADRAALVAADAPRAGGRAPRLLLGGALGLGAAPHADLPRAPGRNLLAVLRDGGAAEIAFTMGVIDDVLRTSPDAEVVLCPFIGVGEELDPYLETLADLDRVRIVPQRRLAAELSELAGTVRSRQADPFGSSGPAQVLILHGVHRSRGLAESSGGSGFSFDAPETPAEDPASDLERILEEGPEVGVHTVAWSDSPSGITRKLSRSAIAAFDLRLAGPLSPDDAADFFDHGISPAQKPRQALFFDRDSGRTQGVLAVTEVPLAWWREEVGALATDDVREGGVVA